MAMGPLEEAYNWERREWREGGVNQGLCGENTVAVGWMGLKTLIIVR
jgi:hypothetical protein